MSLRRALGVLPDDRETVMTVRKVMAFLDGHKGDPVVAQRIARVTGLPLDRIELVVEALVGARVLDCDGDPGREDCTYSPDSILDLEVRRFFRVSDAAESGLHRKVDRFRGRFGAGM